jgi:hypothetical protein
MVDNKLSHGLVASIIGLVLFIGATIIEIAITIWAFKKFGGCPLMDEHR